MNMFDEMFGESLQNLEEAQVDAQGYRLDPKGPFIKGEDLDYLGMSDQEVEELYEYGIEPQLVSRRG